MTPLAGFRRFLGRCRAWLRPGRADRQLSREIDAHLELIAEDLVRKGASPEEARRAARVMFGGVEAVKDQQRHARSFAWLDDGYRDLAYAIRSIRRAPGFSAAAIVTLALGIGGVTLIYSVVHHVLLHPLPYRDPERMLRLTVQLDHNGEVFYFGRDEFRAYALTGAFEDVAGVVPRRSLHVARDAGAVRLNGALVTPNTLDYLGVSPMLGRGFGPADVAADAQPVALLSYRTWTSLLGQDSRVVGTTIRLNGEPHTIIGVMPPRVAWANADVWLPIAFSSPAARHLEFEFHARLRPGLGTGAAESQLTATAVHASAIAAARGRTVAKAALTPIVDRLVGRLRGLLLTLVAAVGLLLAIACVNVANMLLARATAREHEIATRLALGASRSRIIRQLLVEHAVLGAGGAAAGCLLALVGIGAFQGWLPRLGAPAEARLALDLPVLAVALTITALATLACGLYPAVRGVRRDLAGGTLHTARGGTASRRQRRFRSGLIVAEVALSLVLVIGAGLLVRSVLHATAVDLGFDYRHVVVASIGFQPGAELPPPAEAAFYRAVLDDVRRIPGIEGVVISSSFPPGGGGRPTVLGIDGRQGTDVPRAGLIFSSDGVMSALGIALKAGRDLSPDEVDRARHVAVINETLARRYFDGRNPIGRSVRIARLGQGGPQLAFVDGRPRLIDGSAAPGSAPDFAIVGIVGDVANAGIGEPVQPEAYVPYTVAAEVVPHRLFIRSSGGIAPVTAALRRAVAAASSSAAVTDVELLPQTFPGLWPVSDQDRFTLALLAMFALTGLGLVGFGIYGVVAYTVAQRTREFAIRLALGGTPRHVRTQVVQGTAALVGIGVVVGFAASLASARVLTSRLDGISPHDPLTFALAAAVMACTAAAGCARPVRRATRVDPNVALRQE